MIYKYDEKKVITKEVEILSCPFCGSDNVRPVHITGSYGYSSSEDYVMCKDCGAQGASIRDSDCGNHMLEVIDKWNRRY